MCLACGRLDVYVDDAGQASEASMFRKLPRNTYKASRENCISFFGKCKSLIFLQTQSSEQKEFKVLPLIMFRIASENNDEHLVALAICLLMFDSLPKECQARLHPQVRMVFSAEAVFRQEALAAFAAGSFEDSGAIATFNEKA